MTTDSRPAPAAPASYEVALRELESLVADVDLTDTTARTDAELNEVLEILSAEERTVSDKRRKVQEVMDALSAEVTRRYRDGEADVAALLPEE